METNYVGRWYISLAQPKYAERGGSCQYGGIPVLIIRLHVLILAALNNIATSSNAMLFA